MTIPPHTQAIQDRREDVGAKSHADLYYSAVMVRTAVGDAKTWLYQNYAGSDPVRVAAVRIDNAVGIVALMEREYPGGYRAFLAHTSNLREGC